MFPTELFILTTIVLLIGLNVQFANTELDVKLVQVLFRHGDRTPRKGEIWPLDTYGISIYEPWGLAQLTNEGKMTEYRIGKMLRERYNKFLGDIYYPTDVYAYSTDHDRTKMSLQLVLAGLYHPAVSQTWNKNIPWMPIPAHYMPERIDDLLKPDSSPLYIRAIEETRNTEEVLQKVLPYRDFFKFLSEKTGLNITKTNQGYEIYNLLTAQSTMKIPLPGWCTGEVYKMLQDIAKLEYYIRSYTPFMKRLNGGTIIKRFIRNMKINEERERPRKIYLYSGHEINIAAVARALNLTEPEIPPYGCAIIMEKLADQSGKHYIRMLYWSGMTQEVRVYKIPGCDEICPLDKFLNIVNDLLPSHEEDVHKWDYLSKADLVKLYEEQVDVN